MVAGSSLRRPPIKSTQPPEPKAINDEVHPSLSLRSKRIRATTFSDYDQDSKRRKLATQRPQPLQIPLRGKAVHPQVHADPAPGTPIKAIEPPTPTGKPQYDQIRIIEDKARKAVNNDAAGPSKQDDQRKLRKHGGTRPNTELSGFFTNFQEMLSLEPPDPSKHTTNTSYALMLTPCRCLDRQNQHHSGR